MAVESLIIRARQRLEQLRQSVRETQSQTGGLNDELEHVVDSLERAARVMDRNWVQRLRRTGASEAEIIQRAEAARQEQIRVRDARNNPQPPSAPSGGGSGAGGNPAAPAASRAVERAAEGFSSKLGRLLATTGIVAWAFGGINRARDADVANDRLMRVTKGLTGGFDALRTRISDTAVASKLSVEETARLSEHFAKLSGRVDAQTALDETQAGVLAGRSMGMDENTMPQWLAEMRFKGMGDAKALLPIVAATVARSGLGGRAEEVLDGILEYTQRMERTTLKAPDLARFTDLITTFNMQKDLPGLRGAAGMQVYAGLDAAIKNPGAGEAGEMLMYGYYAQNGFPDLFASKKARELGLAGLPGGLEGLLKYIEKYTGLSGDALDVAAGNALNMSPLAVEALRKIDFSKSAGGTAGFVKWLSGKGLDLNAIKPDAYSDMANLYAAQENGDTDTIQGLGQRYLDKDKLASLSGAALVDAILDAMATKGKDTNRLDDTLDRMAKMADMQEAIGRQLLGATNLMFVSAEKAVKWIDDMFGVAEKFNKTIDKFMEVITAIGKKLGLWADSGAQYVPSPIPTDPTTGRDGFWNSFTRGGPANSLMVSPTQGSDPIFPTGNDYLMNDAVGSKHRNLGNSSPMGNVMRWKDKIIAAANKYGIDPALLAGLVEAESKGNPNAVSPDGAVGLGQVMPSTAADYGLSRADLFDPDKNLDVAANYLARQLAMVRSTRSRFLDQGAQYSTLELGLAAYNMGQDNLRKFHGAYDRVDETRNYVPNVLSASDRYAKAFGAQGVDLRLPQEHSSPAPDPRSASLGNGGAFDALYGVTDQNLNITLWTPQGDIVGQQTQRMMNTPATPGLPNLPANDVSMINRTISAALGDWCGRNPGVCAQ